MINIAFVSPDISDPLSYYRGAGPLSHLEKNYKHEFHYEHLASDISWASLKKFDAIFIQRPWLPDHLKVCEIANKWDIPIIGDFDDWLYDLPVSNPAQMAFAAQKKNIVQIVNSLSRIIVTTEKLKTLFQTLLLDQNKPIDVIPNAYEHRVFKNYRHDKNIKDRKMIFAWRGGNSHNMDVMSVKEDYRNLFKTYPQWQFVFIAQNPWILEPAEFSNVQTADPLKLIEYFRALHDAAPSIVAHPLDDNEFNRSKSMCSWLEATHARACFIGPDFEEFQRPGITNYNKENTFFKVASNILDNPQLIAEKWYQSEKYIHENLTLDIVNQKRLAVFKEAAVV